MIPVFGRVSLLASRDDQDYDEQTSTLRIDELVHYEPFCEDFGPFNLACTFRFCKALRTVLDSGTERRVVVISLSDDRSLTNSDVSLAPM